MRIYLAGRFSRREEFVFHAELLLNLGHVITSSWIDCVGQAGTDDEKKKWAHRNVEELARAELVLSFTDEGGGKGGRHVEFGVGLALGKRLVLIGPREHTFHHTAGVERYDTLEQFIGLLKKEGGRDACGEDAQG